MVEVEMKQALPVLWPADKVIFAYTAFMCAIELIWFGQIEDAGWLLALHAIGIILIVLAARSVSQRPSVTSGPIWVFRHWYPLLYVACCYREMAMIIAGIRHNHADRALAAVDHAFWGVYPTVWLERLYAPAFTEFLQIIYTLFLPVAMLVPFLIWRQKRYMEFRYMAFLLALGFLVSYLGYLAVPAHGPRFLLADVQHVPLRGLWLFNSMQATLNRLEQDHYDCFPSGHTELTILACWLSRSISKRLFWVYFLYTFCIVFATVYLRYHFTADLLAGAVVALVLILAAPRLYRVLSEKGDSIGD
jgi:membrane-associated phospholipid phosphatase